VIFDRAWLIHAAICDNYRGVRLSEFIEPDDPRLAQPFGRPPGMPEHQWRVAWNVMQALAEAAPPPNPIPNPKTADGITKLLFGWPVVVDKTAEPGFMILELAE
jgi:hypothetical protein